MSKITIYSHEHRQVVLSNDPIRLMNWSCSRCKWTTPFTNEIGKPADPVEAVKMFNQHRCEDYSAKNVTAA